MDILTECRSYDLVCLRIQSQFYFCKVCKHFFFCKVCSEKCVDALRLKRYSGRFSCLVADIYDSAYDFTCSQFFHKLACTVDRCFGIVRVKTFFEFTGCIGTKSDPLGRETDICSVEACCLKKYGVYIICDHGVFSTHDSGYADCFLAITDHQDLIVHLTFLSIQGYKFLACFCTAHNDLSAFDGIQIVCMHRLTIFFHNIVCDINEVVDRADSVGSQTSLHPFRRWSDLDVFDNSCSISRAKFRIFYGNFDIVRCFFVISCLFYYRRNEFFVKSGCCFSCDSKYAVAVYTVGCDLIFDDNIVKAECFDRALTYDCIFREDVDAVFRSFRVHFSCASKLLDRAHHTAGFYASEFAFFDLDAARSHFAIMTARNTSAVQNDRYFVSFFDIRSTCYDLNGLCSDVYLADDEFVCVRVSFYFVNLSDHDLVEICIQFFEAFHFCS